MKATRLFAASIRALVFGLAVSSLHAENLTLNFRSQVETAEGSGKYHSIVTPGQWKASETCIVICDMWNGHYCRNAERRVGEMAPRMNEVIKAARKLGVLIVHSPSGCMSKYENTPMRKLAQQAPKVKTDLPLESWCYLDPAAEAPMPVKVDQPCDDKGKLRDAVRHFDRQIETLEMKEGDAITDSAEAFYLMKQRGIKNVIIMGVHANMCVLGRPFGIRQMTRFGQNVVLMRDMADTMYNPREEPFVNHFTGNDLVFDIGAPPSRAATSSATASRIVSPATSANTSSWSWPRRNTRPTTRCRPLRLMSWAGISKSASSTPTPRSAINYLALKS